MIPLHVNIRTALGGREFNDRGTTPVWIAKSIIESLLKDENIAYIMITNPANGHSFMWHRVSRIWREYTAPRPITVVSPIKEPKTTYGSKAVIKMNGVVIGTFDSAKLKVNYSKK
jgi:hypothetical protein